jgi:hypothetical protein
VTGRTSDIVNTIRHEVVHVRQFAEIFGNVPDVERRRRWEQMAREMTQNDWVEWNFKLELEAYQIAQGIDNELKSPIQKRAAEEELKAVAKRAGMSIAEFQKRFIIDSVRGLLRAQYEQHWINRWKSLRGDVELAPPYFPKPKLGK